MQIPGELVPRDIKLLDAPYYYVGYDNESELYTFKIYKFIENTEGGLLIEKPVEELRTFTYDQVEGNRLPGGIRRNPTPSGDDVEFGVRNLNIFELPVEGPMAADIPSMSTGGRRKKGSKTTRKRKTKTLYSPRRKNIRK